MRSARWQQMPGTMSDACHDACDHFIDAPALTSVEIDALCEEIGLDSLTLSTDE